MTRCSARRPLLVVLAVLASVGAGADGLDDDATWGELRRDGRSAVFGRIQGRFDGTEYRGRKIRVRNNQTGKEFQMPVEQGLGYFDAALPIGSYSVVSIEAVYFPPIKPMKPNRFPPVQQRYDVRHLPDAGLPTFPVIAERPVYLGTIRSGIGGRGLVYEGHAIEIVDEYSSALERFKARNGALFQGLDTLGIEPTRYFFLKPVAKPEPLEMESDPLEQARDYIEGRKFRQALSWLDTFVPMNDAERTERKLLIGETYLADKNYPDAIEQLGEVLLDDPENMRGLRLLARAHSFEGHREDALNLYQGLANVLPGDAEASLHVGYHHALSSEPQLAEQAFDSAFRENFDYLLHDLSPYALALKAEGALYLPPEVASGASRMPSTMRSRRGSQGGFALLLSHKGRIVAVHMTPNAGQWAPAMMMSVIRARFRPARLNGVAIPCLIIVGVDNMIESALE